MKGGEKIMENKHDRYCWCEFCQTDEKLTIQNQSRCDCGSCFRCKESGE